MTYTDRDTDSSYRSSHSDSPGSGAISTSTLIGTDVFNHKGEDLGNIKDIMLDTDSGNVRYAVLSNGGFLGMGDKLFAVPWSALTLDTVNERFLLDVEQERLANAPGFDKDHWPNTADASWAQSVHSYWTPADATKPNVPPV